MKQNMRLFQALPIVVMLIMVTSGVTAQISKIIPLTKNPVQYEKTEWEITLTEQWNNPYWYADIAVDMTIYAPSGKTLVLPCYFVSGKSAGKSLWKARFAPSETGDYRAHFSISKNEHVVSTSKPVKFNVVAGSGKGFLKNGTSWTFQFDNGEPFRGIGENLCWEARSEDDSKYFKELHEDPRFNYEYLFRLLSKNGGNYTRIWMSSWNLPLEWKIVSTTTNRYENSTDYFNPSAIRKIDRLFELADSLGIYIMLALDQAGSYNGGGWEYSNYNIKNGGFAQNDFDFLVNEQSQEQYKNRLRYLVARWGYSTCLGAWEFFNEVDYLSFDKDTADHSRQIAVVKWHQEMSRFLKKTDPYGHLVTTSISHRDVKGLNAVEHIDFNQKHMYKNTAAIPSTIVNYTAKYNKPYVIGEFGYEWDWSKNFNEFAQEMDSDFKRGLWYGLFSPTPILPMSWWWEFFENRGLMTYFKNVRNISDHMLVAGKGTFETINLLSSPGCLQLYGVKCGSEYFIYVFNPGESNQSITLAFETNLTSPAIQLFDCESGEISDFKAFRNTGSFLQLSDLQIMAKSDKIIMLK